MFLRLIYRYSVFSTQKRFVRRSDFSLKETKTKKNSVKVKKKIEEGTVARIIDFNKRNVQLFGPLIKKDKSNNVVQQEILTEVKDFSHESYNSVLPIEIWKDSSVIDNAISPREKQIVLVKDAAEVSDRNGEEEEPDRDTQTGEVREVPTVQTYTEKGSVLVPFPMVCAKNWLPSETDSVLTVASAECKYPSVTHILNETMPESSAIALAVWRKRKIAEVGEDGLREFIREAKLTGKDLHARIETFLRGVPYDGVHIDPRIAGHWLSLKSILNSLYGVRVLESYVVHSELKYKGFVDCVAFYEGNLVVIDWKTSQRRKSKLDDTYDDPIQIAAYIGALNADANYPFQVENALLVIAYPTGIAADVLYLDRDLCEMYWQSWLKRLEKFYHVKNSLK